MPDQSRTIHVSEKTPIRIQMGILAAIIVGSGGLAYQVGVLATRAENRLGNIERGQDSLTTAVDGLTKAVKNNDTGVAMSNRRMDTMDAQGTAYCRAMAADMAKLKACAKAGKRLSKCEVWE